MGNKLEKLFNQEVEESVLSSYIYDNESFFAFEAKQKYFTGHRVFIFNAIMDLLKSGFQADIVSISSKLSGVVKASFIAEIMEKPISVNLEYHIKELQNCATLRDLHTAYAKGKELCENGLQVESILSSVNSMIDIGGEDEYQQKTSDIVIDCLEQIDRMHKSGVAPGFKTGLSLLDWNLGGLRDQDLIIIAGRPGNGKTILAMNIARKLGFEGIPGVIFSLEMSRKKLIYRQICDVGNIHCDVLFRNKIEPNHWPIINEASAMISNFKIEINDRPGQSIDTIYLAAKKAKMVMGARFLIVDYLQLITGWNSTGQGPKSEITRQLKMMAKDLDMPVIVLSQLNREIDKREKKIPRMSDLRDAGSIEQDADVVMFVHAEKELERVQIFIAKNREGRECVVDGIKWEGEYFRFSQLNAGW